VLSEGFVSGAFVFSGAQDITTASTEINRFDQATHSIANLARGRAIHTDASDSSGLEITSKISIVLLKGRVVKQAVYHVKGFTI